MFILDESSRVVDKSVVLLPGAGRSLSVPGCTALCKVGGEETGGAWAAVECTLAPDAPGLPLHVNTQEDQAFYILQGTLTFRLGERTVYASAESLVFVPRGSVHTFRNLGGEPVRFLCVVSPAGLEKSFTDLLELLKEGPAWSHVISRLIPLYRKYGLQIKGPPLNK
ncbi:MAG TPA: cupin domain-containing protein [Chloroflexia bacterium]|nr:cupin domain-containing protein [Chloroflexia bacterium]